MSSIKEHDQQMCLLAGGCPELEKRLSDGTEDEGRGDDTAVEPLSPMLDGEPDLGSSGCCAPG
jgi:hypothetical protein